MSLQIIDPSNDKRWDEFVFDHPDGTIFHTSNWARVIQKTYGCEPNYFILEDRDKNIKAAIPFFLLKNIFSGNRFVCLPFTDECSPLFTLDQDIERIIFTIVKTIKEKKLDYVEIRSGKVGFLSEFKLKNHNYYKTFRLDLSCGIDNLWKGFKQKSIRYPIKKAEASNLKIENSQSESDMKIFYALNVQTRKKHGVISQPYKFFKNILQELIANEQGFLLIAKYSNKAIAGSIFFVYKDTIYHKFNASDVNYLKYQPNHLILWRAIQYAVQTGLKHLDMGRTSPDNIGLMSFKHHWGAKEFDLPYYYWPEVKGTSATRESGLKYRLMSSLCKKMPIPMFKIAGDLLYKHLG